MSEVETKTITIKLLARVVKLGGARRGQDHAASVGRFEASGDRKPAVLDTIAEDITRAVQQRDLGEVLAWSVEGARLILVHVRHDGRYQVVSGPLARDVGPGSPDLWHGHGDTYAAALERMNAAMRGELERVKPRDDSPVEALRRLALSAGTDATGDWPDLAQRVGFTLADWRYRIEESGLACLGDLVVQCAAARDLTVEGAALERLLGLRGPVAVAAAALQIVTSTRTSRWGGTLTDLRGLVGGVDPLETVDLACAACGVLPDLDDMVAKDDVESTLIETDWQDKGVIDALIAKRIRGWSKDVKESEDFEDDSLAARALTKRIEDERAAARTEALRQKPRVKPWRLRRFRPARVSAELQAARDLCDALDGEHGVVADALADLLAELEHRGVDLPAAVVDRARAALNRVPVREVVWLSS